MHVSISAWMILTIYSEGRLDLIPIGKSAEEPLQYTYDLNKSIRLPGAHGDEIVRDAFTDINVSLPSYSLVEMLMK